MTSQPQDEQGAWRWNARKCWYERDGANGVEFLNPDYVNALERGLREERQRAALADEAVSFVKHLDLISRGNPMYGRLARDWLERYDALKKETDANG